MGTDAPRDLGLASAWGVVVLVSNWRGEGDETQSTEDFEGLRRGISGNSGERRRALPFCPYDRQGRGRRHHQGWDSALIERHHCHHRDIVAQRGVACD